MKSIYEKLMESIITNDKDLQQLINIAKDFDDPYLFDRYLSRNYGYRKYKDYWFIRERFSRLTRGTRLTDSGKTIMYRTGDQPIVWGDYVYTNEESAKESFNAGQGNKVYNKVVNTSDIIESSIPGEYYYSPISIARYNKGDGLIDLWYLVHDQTKPVETQPTEIKPNKNQLISELKTKAKELSFYEFENYYWKYCDYHNINPFMLSYEQIYYKYGRDKTN